MDERNGNKDRYHFERQPASQPTNQLKSKHNILEGGIRYIGKIQNAPLETKAGNRRNKDYLDTQLYRDRVKCLNS